MPALSPLELTRLRDAAASDLLAEIIARQGINCFDGASGRSRSAQPLIFVSQESRLASAPSDTAVPGIPVQAVVSGPELEVVVPAQADVPSTPRQNPASEVSGIQVPLHPPQVAPVEPPPGASGPPSPPLALPALAAAHLPASKSRP